MKLEAPKSRDLREQTKIWKKIIEQKHIADLYTGLNFMCGKFCDYHKVARNYGTISLNININ